jgi:hypothetical protein
VLHISVSFASELPHTCLRDEYMEDMLLELVIILIEGAASTGCSNYSEEWIVSYFTYLWLFDPAPTRLCLCTACHHHHHHTCMMS